MTANRHSQPGRLRLRVHPNAARNEINGWTDGVLQVKVAAPPVQGKANRELTSFISRLLKVSKSSVSIVKGHTSRDKVITVEGLSQDDIISRLSI